VPRFGHLLGAPPPRRCQPVIFAWVPSFCLNPFRAEQPFRFQAREDRIYSSFGYVELRACRQSPKDFQAVKPFPPEASKNSHFEAPLAKLGFPPVSAFGDIIDSHILCNAMYLAINRRSRQVLSVAMLMAKQKPSRIREGSVTLQFYIYS